MTAPCPSPSQATDETRAPSSRSLRGIDALSFLMADVRDGLGPFLSVFLKGNQNWPSGQIGIVMAASGVAAALAQIPAGLLVDSVRAKRLILASRFMADENAVRFRAACQIQTKRTAWQVVSGTDAGGRTRTADLALMRRSL